MLNEYRLYEVHWTDDTREPEVIKARSRTDIHDNPSLSPVAAAIPESDLDYELSNPSKKITPTGVETT